MLSTILGHLRSQWMGALALFLVLTGGAAYAADTVFSGDIVDNEVYSVDVRNDTLTGGGLNAADLRTGSVRSPEVLDDTAGGGLAAVDLAPGSVRGSEILNESITGSDLAGNSVNTPKVVNDSLFGVDIREDTLSPLDAHDAFDNRCDPTSTTLVTCVSLDFFLQRSMPVLTIFNWAHYSDNDQGDRIAGLCRTRIDGSFTSGDIWVGSESASGNSWRAAATPVVDVVTLGPGAHTMQLACSQNLRDIVFGDIRIAAVELGAD